MRCWITLGSSLNLITPQNCQISGNGFLLRRARPAKTFFQSAAIWALVMPRLKTMAFSFCMFSKVIGELINSTTQTHSPRPFVRRSFCEGGCPV